MKTTKKTPRRWLCTLNRAGMDAVEDAIRRAM